MEKPVVYVASPYSTGDPAINTHFQCQVFDQLLTDGKVWPVVPLWTHFQHVLFPRPYSDWIEYDKALLRLYDACLRLNATVNRGDLSYSESKSSGADGEVAIFREIKKPVFFSIKDLYSWVDERSNATDLQE